MVPVEVFLGSPTADMPLTRGPYSLPRGLAPLLRSAGSLL
jgi:hypothetical protein